VFYAEKVDAQGVLHNVHVFVDHASVKGSSTGEVEVWVATRAEQRGAGQSEQLFVMYDGEMYQGVPGSGEFRIVEFTEAGFPISMDGGTTAAGKTEMKSSSELLQSNEPGDVAELQRRISTPVLALVLMLIAVPLARIRPRQGRFGRIGIAILLYFIYSLLLDASAAWIISGTVPGFVGLWWVHGLAIVIGVLLLLRESPPRSWRVGRVAK
jgi:lipopolysaccharide export system permease protein